MSSGDARAVARLLDPAFGLFVWFGHLVAIYLVTALWCGVRPALGWVGESRGALVVTLSILTLAAAAVVISHGRRRYRDARAIADAGFLHRLAVGQDGIATLAILWQFFPLVMVPLCA